MRYILAKLVIKNKGHETDDDLCPTARFSIHCMEKRWRLYILAQYLANLTEPLARIESRVLAKFVPVLAKLCMQA